jgi:ATP adenylyltransferase
VSHEQLWAPWRLAYILSHKSKNENAPVPAEGEGCFLCRYRDETADAENFVVARGAHSLVVLNRFPYNNGHLLVAPRAHKPTLEELDDAELLECMQQLRRMTALYSKVLSPDGYNIGLNLGRVAGAGLPGHLHWHLVPRWNGDTSFMPVLADVSVIPQSLEELYRILQEALRSAPR